MSGRNPVIALTIGDPAGIGPEIAADLIESGALNGLDVLVIGSARSLMEAMGPVRAREIRAVPYEAAGDAEEILFPAVIDTAGSEEPPAGGPSAAGGTVSGRAVEAAIGMARSGAVDGIVTGPISKEALSLAGYPYTGHTEMLREMFSAPDCQMMMVDGGLRIVIMTRDIPLRNVPSQITGDRIRSCLTVTESSLKELWSVKAPSIAVAALNPHAGDGGVTGSEEKDIIVPVIEELREKGMGVVGPVPADTLFQERGSGLYDAYIAMYHDQGMIPFKARGFGRGVNMTIGLPVVRTSVCHGTAYDLAGSGKADSGSLEAAFSMAVECCRAKMERAGV